jgi:hypothetical protein
MSGPQIRSGRRGEEKFLTLQGLGLLPLGDPARSQSLYCLCYLGSCKRKWRCSYVILDLCTIWSRVFNFTLLFFTPGKETSVFIGHEAGAPQGRFGKIWRSEKSCTDENRTPTVQPVTRRYTDSA